MLSHTRSGSGVPLVFLHAFPLDRSLWDAQKTPFSKNFQFISLDFPGSGASPLPPEPPTLRYYAEQVKATLDELGITEKAVVTGLSMGGYALFELYRLMPERIRALVFISTRATPDSEAAKKKRAEGVENVRKNGAGPFVGQAVPNLFGASSREAKLPVIEKTLQAARLNSAEGIASALQAMATRRDSTDVLPSISVPSLIIYGAEDGVVAQAEMESMAHQIKKSEFHVFPKAGHLLTLERPDEFETVFKHFLKRRVL